MLHEEKSVNATETVLRTNEPGQLLASLHRVCSRRVDPDDAAEGGARRYAPHGGGRRYRAAVKRRYQPAWRASEAGERTDGRTNTRTYEQTHSAKLDYGI